jgi:hypothetical protein
MARAEPEQGCEAGREAARPEQGSVDGFKDECGVFAAIGVPQAAAITALGLHALQHRGQESTGVVSAEGERGFNVVKGIGLVHDVYRDADLERLTGVMAIGHNRYSTSGGLTLENTQPLRVVYRGGGGGGAPRPPHPHPPPAGRSRSPTTATSPTRASCAPGSRSRDRSSRPRSTPRCSCT